jgi:hypothetical protein
LKGRILCHEHADQLFVSLYEAPGQPVSLDE